MQLAEIGHALDESGWDLEQAMQRHRALQDQRLAISGRLRERAGRMLTAAGDEQPLTTRQFLDTMAEVVLLDSPYDEESRSWSTRTSPPPNATWSTCSGPVRAACIAPTTAPSSTPRCTRAVLVDDVDAHAAAQGAEIVYPPTDQPYGYREYSARDAEGGFWSFMTPLD